MPKKKTAKNSLGVDKSLVAMFLKMSPEERLQANDNAVRTIQELRDAHKQQRNDRSYKPKDVLKNQFPAYPIKSKLD